MEFGGVASFSFLPEPPSPGTGSEPLTCLPLESREWAVPELPATTASQSLPRDAPARAQVWFSFGTASGEAAPAS